MEGCENLGFPIAELAADGSCTITKEANTGGEVGEYLVLSRVSFSKSYRSLLVPLHHSYYTRFKAHFIMVLM